MFIRVNTIIIIADTITIVMKIVIIDLISIALHLHPIDSSDKMTDPRFITTKKAVAGVYNKNCHTGLLHHARDDSLVVLTIANAVWSVVGCSGLGKGMMWNEGLIFIARA